MWHQKGQILCASLSTEYIAENNENEYLTLIPTDEIKDTLKKYEIWNKVKNIFTSTSNNSDDFDEKRVKIKFHSDDDSFLNKTLKLQDIIIIVKSALNDDSKCYPLVP